MDKIALIQRKYRGQRIFYSHAFVFLFFMALVWLNALNRHWNLQVLLDTHFDIIAVTVGWSAILLFHFMQWQISTHENNALLSALTENPQQQSNQETYEKVKRHTIYEDEVEVEMDATESKPTNKRLQLSDDGELIATNHDSDSQNLYSYQ